MVKAIVFVEGNVQGVSLRAFVKQLARKFKLKGLAKNLEDGRVKLFLDGEKSCICSFVEILKNKKGDFENPFSLHVEKVIVKFEGEKGFKTAWKKYKSFEIDYGEKLKGFEKESLERLEIGSIVLQDFRNETRNSFGTIDSKYGIIHEEMVDFKTAVKELTTTLKQDRQEIKNISKAMLSIANNFSPGKNVK